MGEGIIDNILKYYSIVVYFFILCLTAVLSTLCFTQSRKIESGFGRLLLIFLGIFLILIGIGICIYVFLRNNSNNIAKKLDDIYNHKYHK